MTDNPAMCQLFVILCQNRNEMMKHLLIVVTVALILGSCAEKKSPLDAEARDSGMRAAAALVAVDHTDTMSMERAVMDAKANRACMRSNVILLQSEPLTRLSAPTSRRKINHCINPYFLMRNETIAIIFNMPNAAAHRLWRRWQAR